MNTNHTVHPRYRALQQQKKKEASQSTFGARLFIALILLIAFVVCKEGNLRYHDWSATKVNQLLAEDFFSPLFP